MARRLDAGLTYSFVVEAEAVVFASIGLPRSEHLLGQPSSSLTTPQPVRHRLRGPQFLREMDGDSATRRWWSVKRRAS
jgi:hypothetical protein